jgi:hypothetical protein
MAQAQVAPKVSIEIEAPEDNQAKRNRLIRWFVAAVLIGITAYLPTEVVSYVGEVLDHPTIGSFIGFGIGIWLLGLLVPRLFVDNPEWSAYVTLNPLGGYMIPYGPGIHASLPWEERNEDGNYSLEVITRSFTLTCPTKTSSVTISGRLFYSASLPYITNAIGVDQEIVEDGLIAFIESNLLATLTDMEAEEAIKSTPTISDNLNKTFRDQQAVTPNDVATPEEFEKKFGYSTAAIVIDRIAFSPKVQEALDAVSEARKMNEIAANLLGVSQADLAQMLRDKIITVKQVKEALDRALVASGNATMNLNVIEGDMGNAVANFLTQGNKGGKS